MLWFCCGFAALHVCLNKAFMVSEGYGDNVGRVNWYDTGVHIGSG